MTSPASAASTKGMFRSSVIGDAICRMMMIDPTGARHRLSRPIIASSAGLRQRSWFALEGRSAAAAGYRADPTAVRYPYNGTLNRSQKASDTSTRSGLM
jgi:hypothetical protein